MPDQKNASYAIIEADDHLQKKYRPGEELPGGSTLQSIAKEQVMLLRNNQRESLSMDRKKTGLL
ncbi:MAG: type II secretion system protein N, partial [bacterium]|nr:type II secretion system protein N [bacterium]